MTCGVYSRAFEAAAMQRRRLRLVSSEGMACVRRRLRLDFGRVTSASFAGSCRVGCGRRATLSTCSARAVYFCLRATMLSCSRFLASAAARSARLRSAAFAPRITAATHRPSTALARSFRALSMPLTHASLVRVTKASCSSSTRLLAGVGWLTSRL